MIPVRDMPGSWVACRQVLFNGRTYQAKETLLEAGADWPCDMQGLAQAGLAMHVPEGYEMWRPHISANWRLRELTGTATPAVPEPPPAETKPEPPPAPVVQPVVVTQQPRKRSKRKARRRRSGG